MLGAIEVEVEPPRVGSLMDQSATEDAAFSFIVAAGVVTDPQGLPLTFSATLADGSALPSWLAFNRHARVQRHTRQRQRRSARCEIDRDEQRRAADRRLVGLSIATSTMRRSLPARGQSTCHRRTDFSLTLPTASGRRRRRLTGIRSIALERQRAAGMAELRCRDADFRRDARECGCGCDSDPRDRDRHSGIERKRDVHARGRQHE